MASPSHTQADEMCAEVVAIGTRLRRDWPTVAAEARAAAPGFPTSSGLDGGGGGGGPADPVGEMVVSGAGTDDGPVDEAKGPDRIANPAADAYRTMVRNLLRALDQLRNADVARESVCPSDVVDLQSKAKAKTAPGGQGECDACGRYCPGGPDRLRTGLCIACYRAWSRTDAGHGRWDRADFLRWRPQALAVSNEAQAAAAAELGARIAAKTARAAAAS